MSSDGGATDHGRIARSAGGVPGRILLVWGLAGIAIVGLALRLRGLDAPSLSHTEIYVPGLDLPPAISIPPPRHGFAETLSFHYHDEPHPIGWYMLMWAWTSLSGATEWTVRLPSAVFGTLSILAVAALARQVHGTAAAVLAAAMLALDGFHVHWSQAARMYVAGAFWCTLSLILLMELARSPVRRPWLEAAYVVAVVAAVQSTELSWVVFGLQVLWAAVLLPMPPDWRPMRLVQVQAIALMVAAPALLHALYRARRDPVDADPLTFIADYFTGGFLFQTLRWPIPEASVPAPLALALLAAAMGLILLGLTRSTVPHVPAVSGMPPALPRWVMLGISVAFAGLMAWLAAIALRRQIWLMGTATLPLAALALPRLARLARQGIIDRIGVLRRVTVGVDPWTALLALVGIGAPLALFAVSPLVLVLADRAFLVFVPALIVLMAAGATRPWRSPVAAVGVPAAVLAVFLASTLRYGDMPQSPNDYKSLAQQMRDHMQPGDLVFVRAQSWADTPVLYYLPGATFVTEDYAAAFAAAPSERVWVLTWPDNWGKTLPGDWVDVVAGHTPSLTLEALRARAELYNVRRSP